MKDASYMLDLSRLQRLTPLKRPSQKWNKTPSLLTISQLPLHWGKLATQTTHPGNLVSFTRFRTQQIWGEKKDVISPSQHQELALQKLLPKCQQEEVLVIPASHGNK